MRIEIEAAVSSRFYFKIKEIDILHKEDPQWDLSENIIRRQMVNYITESYKELKNHVTWPTWAEAQKLTVIVAVFSVLLALAVWGVDTVFSKVVGLYFEWIKS